MLLAKIALVRWTRIRVRNTFLLLRLPRFRGNLFRSPAPVLLPSRFLRGGLALGLRFKLSNLSNIDIDVSALYPSAAPSTPEPVRAEVMRP